MKRIQSAFLAIWLLTSIAAISQSKNPYKSIGKKSETLTLTKGKYEEFFDQDSIQQVGSVLMNVRTMKVIKLLNEQEAKQRLENEKGSRFLSVDPLTSSFPMLTPYQYASNNPVQNIDLDGLEGMAGNLCSPGKWHIPGDADDNGQYTKQEIKQGAKIMLKTGGLAIAGTILIADPAVGVPFALTYLTGAPATPSPQAMSEGVSFQQGMRQSEVALDEASTEATTATRGMSGGISKVSKNMVAKNVENQTTAATGSIDESIAESGNAGRIPQAQNLAVKRAQQLKINNSNSKTSEDIVFDRLSKQLGEEEAILKKPRIYIGDGSSGEYATPDFALYNKRTGQITRIVDAKDGGGGLSGPQLKLNQQGGTFRGSSRSSTIKPQAVKSGSVEIERTNVKTGG